MKYTITQRILIILIVGKGVNIPWIIMLRIMTLWSVHVKFILLSFHVMLVLHLPKYSLFAESLVTWFSDPNDLDYVYTENRTWSGTSMVGSSITPFHCGANQISESMVWIFFADVVMKRICTMPYPKRRIQTVICVVDFNESKVWNDGQWQPRLYVWWKVD
jgi:hypothetical protein